MTALAKEAVGGEASGGSHQFGVAELPDPHRLTTVVIAIETGREFPPSIGWGGGYSFAVPVVGIAGRDGRFSIAGDVTSHMNYGGFVFFPRRRRRRRRKICLFLSDVERE